MTSLSTELKTHKVSVKDDNGKTRYLYLTDKQTMACLEAKNSKGHFTYKDQEGGMFSYPARLLGAVEPARDKQTTGKTCTDPLGVFICYANINGEKESIVRRDKKLISNFSTVSSQYGYWKAEDSLPWRGHGVHPPHKATKWQIIPEQELERIKI